MGNTTCQRLLDFKIKLKPELKVYLQSGEFGVLKLFEIRNGLILKYPHALAVYLSP